MANRALTPSLFTALIFITALACAPIAHATTALPTLSQSDFDNVIRELSANSNYSSVTPPSSLGKLFGFELGLVGGVTATPNIDSLVNQSTGSNAKYFPHASLLAAITIPAGITVEGVYVPRTNIGDLSYQTQGLALKWSLEDQVLPDLPLHLSVKAFTAKTQFSFDQSVSGINETVNYDGQVNGLQLLVSPKLIIIEPYAGIGYLNAKGDITLTGSNTLFLFTSSQSAESTPSSTQLILGADVRLLLLAFGLEYSRAFGTSSYTGRFSMRF